MPRSPLTRVAIACITGIALAGGAFAALAEPPRAGSAPDPPPQASRKQWSVEIAAESGKIMAKRADVVMLDKPQATARVIGRFALELYVGSELLDRARFTLPLLDAPPEDSSRGRIRRPSFQQVTTRIRVRIADSPRASYLVLVDRATGDTQRFEWPPEADGSLVTWKAGRLGGDGGPGDDAGKSVKLTEPRDGGAGDAGDGAAESPSARPAQDAAAPDAARR